MLGATLATSNLVCCELKVRHTDELNPSNPVFDDNISGVECSMLLHYNTWNDMRPLLSFSNILRRAVRVRFATVVFGGLWRPFG